MCVCARRNLRSAHIYRHIDSVFFKRSCCACVKQMGKTRVKVQKKKDNVSVATVVAVVGKKQKQKKAKGESLPSTISNPVLRRFALRNGVTHVASDVYPIINNLCKATTRKLMYDAIQLTIQEGLCTIKDRNYSRSMGIHGIKIY